MRRRNFIAGLASTTAAWSLAARAQQSPTMPVIGYLNGASAAQFPQLLAGFHKGLSETGYSEGRDVAFEYRYADGQYDRLPALAADLVSRRVSVIVATAGTPTIRAAKAATSTIPIVFVIGGDPVTFGIVASLAHPGGNATGLSSQASDTAGKRLELMREIIPNLHRLAVLTDTDNPFVKLDVSQLRQAGTELGVDVATFEMRRGEDIDPAFRALKSQAQALYVPAIPLAFVNRIRINTLALAAHLPTMLQVREYVEAGGLMSYGPNWPHMWRRAADLVDKILRGAKPSDIPVEQPTEFDLVINLTTAKALGLTIPEKLLATADEVIE